MRIPASNAYAPVVKRGKPIKLHLNGAEITAFEGETIAAVLLAEGIRIFRRTLKSGAPRGIFCGMGTCYDCLVTVNGTPHVRACITPVAADMIIETRSEIDAAWLNG